MSKVPTLEDRKIQSLLNYIKAKRDVPTYLLSKQQHQQVTILENCGLVRVAHKKIDGWHDEEVVYPCSPGNYI